MVRFKKGKAKERPTTPFHSVCTPSQCYSITMPSVWPSHPYFKQNKLTKHHSIMLVDCTMTLILEHSHEYRSGMGLTKSTSCMVVVHFDGHRFSWDENTKISTQCKGKFFLNILLYKYQWVNGQEGGLAGKVCQLPHNNEPVYVK